MSGLPTEAINQLKVFVQLLKSKPEILHTSEMAFFKSYLESLGGKIPDLPKEEKKA